MGDPVGDHLPLDEYKDEFTLDEYIEAISLSEFVVTWFYSSPKRYVIQPLYIHFKCGLCLIQSVDYSYGFQMKQNAFIFFGQNLETPTTVWWWQVVEEGGNSLESCRMRGL